MPDESLLRLVFGTPIRPGGRTLGQILGRKVAKRTLRDALGISGTPDPGSRKRRKKRADVEEPNVALAKMALLNIIGKLAAIEKEAPFKSQAQRRKFHAMAARGEISKKTVKKWEDHTPKGKKLPERIHRKSAEEKLALWGAIGRGLLSLGKGVVGGTSKVVKPALKSMLYPTTGAQTAAGTVGWTGLGAFGAGKAGPGFRMQPMQPRMASIADRLTEMTKESFELRTYSPASTDVAEPIVKKNSMNKSSAAASSLGTGLVPVTPARTSARSLSTVNPGTKWLGQQTTMGKIWKDPARPDVRKTPGMAGEAREPAPEAGSHIQRGGV